MMKNNLFSLLAILGLMAFSTAQKDITLPPTPPREDLCSSSNSTFQSGEELTYKIYYNWNFVWIAAGEVTIKVEEEQHQYHISAKGKTYPSYEWFFTVDDNYDSWLDKNTLLPNYSERKIKEGNYSIYEKISFDQSQKKMVVWRADKKGDTEKRTEHSVSTCVHDVLSAMYSMRNNDYNGSQVGSTLPFSVFMDKEEYPLGMKYLGKNDNKKVHGQGRYKTLVFEPKVIKGNVFKEGEGMKVWASDDANRIPVLIESPVSVGSVKVVLKSYKGLKYNFEGKL